MATASNLRLRRSAAQLHALVGVERDIRAQDPTARRKYVQDFSRAFQTYQRVLDRGGLERFCNESDILLVGD